MKCPVCGSESLSKETQYASYENHLRYKEWKTGFIGNPKDLAVSAKTGRFCLDCGYLMLFVRQSDIEDYKKGPDW